MSLILKAAGAALILGATSGAYAIDVANYAADNAAGKVVNVYVSGSTAANIVLWDSAVHDYIAANGAHAAVFALCHTPGDIDAANPAPAGGLPAASGDNAAGTIDVYTDGADSKNPGSQMFIFCTAKSSLGLSGQTEIAIFKESTAGSGNGSTPLITIAKGGSNTLKFVNPASLATDEAGGGCNSNVGGSVEDYDTNGLAAAAGNAPNSLHGTQAYVHHNCANLGTTDASVPSITITGGISDVEGKLVGASGSDISSFLTATPGLDPVWAVPVNLTLLNMLQKAQGLTQTTSAATLTAANTPTLTHAQLAAIYAFQLNDPSQIVGSGAAVGTSIGLCRREDISGTNASAEVFWLGEGCGFSNPPSIVAGSDLALPGPDSTNIFEETSTGKIAGCLEAMDTGATITDTTGTNPSGGPARPGIGIISSENGSSTFTFVPAAGSTPATAVAVIGVDGALPTLENVVNGYYPFFSEDVLYNITSATKYTGNPKVVWEAVKKNIGTPAYLADSNSSFVNYWGQSGDLSPPTIYGPGTTVNGAAATVPATSTTVSTYPLNTLSKSAGGNGINNCDPAVVYGTNSNTAPYQDLNH